MATRVPDLPRGRDNIYSGNHGLCFVHCLHYLVAHPCRNARVHVDQARVRNAGSKFAAERAAGFRPHIVGEEHRDHLVVRLLLCCIRKPGLRGSLVLDDDLSGSTLPLSRTKVTASSATCWPKARFSGLPTKFAIAFTSTMRASCRPRDAFVFRILSTELVEAFARDFAGLNRLNHCIVRSGEIGGNEQQIVAGLESLHRGPADVVGEKVSQAGHVERVGDDDSFEAKLFFKQVRDNRRRNRGHVVGIGIERRNSDVRHHDGVDARRDGPAKRRQFDGIQMSAINVHAGYAEMRIGCRIPVTRKMFDRGQHSTFMRALDISRDQIAHLLGIFAE